MTTNTLAIASYISRRLDEISTSEDLPVHDSWPRVAAEMLGYDIDGIDFFPNRDTGIDFCYRSERAFEVFQAKMHYLDDKGDVDLKAAYGPQGWDDLLNALDFLFRKSEPANIDSRLLAFREQLQEEVGLSISIENALEDIPKVSLVLRLITLGDHLTPEAKSRLKVLKERCKQLESENLSIEIAVDHVGLSQLGDFFESPDVAPRKPEPIRLRVAYEALNFKDPQLAEISTGNFVTFYTRAADLVVAARKEGVALFDANVRYELSSSNINQQIRQSASHPKTMRLFHLYNNGVTITASGWSYQEGKRRIEARDPSVINGCQTVRSLERVMRELKQVRDEDPHRMEVFQNDCLVLVRLVRKDVVDTEEIVRAANTQNAMEPRNLLANQTEQRALEREFAEYGWFYERKDGSLDALKESKRSYFGTPLSNFAVPKKGPGRRLFRACDNREVARRWLSYIGWSDEGKNKRRQHFPADGKGLYTKIFRQTPEFHRDYAMLVKKISADSIKMFDSRPPTMWMLYANHLFELNIHLLPIASRLRARVRRELLDARYCQELCMPI